MAIKHTFIINRSLCFLYLICILLSACGQDYTPKPRGYPRIILPEHAYQKLQTTDCPFTFEYGQYAKIAKDTLFFNQKPEHPCWMSVEYPDLNSSMYISYKEIDGKKESLAKLIEDAHTLNSKHIIRADYIEDSLILTDRGVYGLYYNVGGNAASSTQFFLTDSVKHFIWASLYVKDTPNEDSIAPLTKFLKTDVEHFLQTFSWK